MAGGSFFSELRRRKVLQAAAIYGAVAWGVTEIIVTVTEQLYLPRWVSTLAVISFVVGFPVVMFLSWTFDITSEGIKRTDVASRRGKASIALSMFFLLAGTYGLFMLIKPSLESSRQNSSQTDIIPNSIAVLPFENTGQDAGDAYLSKGLSDGLRDQLGRLAELRVAARSSSVAALDRGMDAISAAANLGVEHLVEGNMRRQRNRLQVSVQLIEGRTGLVVWSANYDRGTKELLNMQQAIFDEIVRTVLPGVTSTESVPATRDADANELMLLANYYEQQVRSRQVVDNETLLEAIRLYRQATEIDTESALAHSRLAGTLLYLGDIDAAEAPIRTALVLDPKLSEVQNTLGEFHWARGDDEAGSAFRRAVELNPQNSDALHNYASLTWMTIAGQTSGIDPGELFQRALTWDRLSLSRYSALGDFLGKEGRVDEVRPLIQEIIALFDDAESFRVVAWLHELIGELDLAIAWTMKAREKEPDNSDHVEKLADLFAQIGDAKTALLLEPSPSLGLLLNLRRYDELIDAAEFMMIEDPDDIEIRYLLAFAYVAVGDFEPAIYVLSSTGLPDTVLNDRARSVSEIEAFMTLINALAGSEIPEAVELAQSLAQWQEKLPWWGDIGWIALYRSCNYAILGQHEKALQLLPRIKESARLRRFPVLRDSWCFRQYAENTVYLNIVNDLQTRQAELRSKLPATLAAIGISP